MNVEIERKYLLRTMPRLPRTDAVLEIDQGYIPGEKLIERLRRQRAQDGSVRYFRTIKLGSGIQRTEIEDETSAAIFTHLWELTKGKRLTKRRHVVPNGDDLWEIDEFTDRDLVLAELELEHAGQAIEIPEWLRAVLVREVTDEKAYTNRSLAR